MTQIDREYLDTLDRLGREEVATFFKGQRQAKGLTMKRMSEELDTDLVDVHRLESPRKCPTTIRGIMRAAVLYGYRAEVTFHPIGELIDWSKMPKRRLKREDV